MKPFRSSLYSSASAVQARFPAIRSFDFPAHADVTVRLIGEEILVQGEITARLRFVCSRCLTPFEFPVASRFDLVYLPEELDGFSDELSDDKMDQRFYSARQLA